MTTVMNGHSAHSARNSPLHFFVSIRSPASGSHSWSHFCIRDGSEKKVLKVLEASGLNMKIDVKIHECTPEISLEDLEKLFPSKIPK